MSEKERGRKRKKNLLGVARSRDCGGTVAVLSSVRVYHILVFLKIHGHPGEKEENLKKVFFPSRLL